MRPNASPVERFTVWYTTAVTKLKELPEGDGAFAAMLIVIPLYERAIIAKLKLDGVDPTKDNLQKAISVDLKLDDRQRRIFWAMFRIGFTHQGMPQKGPTQWLVSHRFGALPEFKQFNGAECVCFDPWKFAERVLSQFAEDPRLITESESFPLPAVFSISPSALTPGSSPL